MANFSEVKSLNILFLVITSINLEVLALTNMEIFMTVFLEKEFRFSTSFQHKTVLTFYEYFVKNGIHLSVYQVFKITK